MYAIQRISTGKFLCDENLSGSATSDIQKAKLYKNKKECLKLLKHLTFIEACRNQAKEQGRKYDYTYPNTAYFEEGYEFPTIFSIITVRIEAVVVLTKPIKTVARHEIFDGGKCIVYAD